MTSGTRWGHAFVRACNDYRNANDKLEELFVRVQACWWRIANQLEVTKTLESTMADDYKDLQQRMLFVLSTKLENAIQKLSECDKHPIFNMSKRLKFVRLRDALEESITELESWQRRSEPSWFSLIKYAPTQFGTLVDVVGTTIESSPVARKFRRAFVDPARSPQSSFISKSEFRRCGENPVSHSMACIATRPGGRKAYIVDTATEGAVAEDDARAFAWRLRDSDPFTFGILKCKGAVNLSTRTRSAFRFVFYIPEGYTNIRSVRQLLLSGQSHGSLSDRLEMAKRLAKAVYYVHLYGFVHKSIRPETMLTISRADEVKLPSIACLVGFQLIRQEDGKTYSVADCRWETNVYRHPRRQGSSVDYYVMQHDIYSLGVCLLEIGLWESLVVYQADGIAQPSAALGLDSDRSQLQNPDALKDHLTRLSRSTALRAKMGTYYSEVVETCLTCLDEDNVDFGDERDFQDEDGAAVGVRYMEKILGKLDRISL